MPPGGVPVMQLRTWSRVSTGKGLRRCRILIAWLILLLILILRERHCRALQQQQYARQNNSD